MAEIQIMLKDFLEQIDKKVKWISVTEGNCYDYFKVCVVTDDYQDYIITDTRNSRVSDMVFTDTTHDRIVTENIVRQIQDKIGEVKVHWNYHFIHNEQCWEEDTGDFDGYYGDGLDHIEELNYMD